MIKSAEKASKLVIRDFGEVEKLQVSKKGPRDFVTKTDKRVENIIIEELSKTKKNNTFLSEEIGKMLKYIFFVNSKFLPLRHAPIVETCSNRWAAIGSHGAVKGFDGAATGFTKPHPGSWKVHERLAEAY